MGSVFAFLIGVLYRWRGSSAIVAVLGSVGITSIARSYLPDQPQLAGVQGVAAYVVGSSLAGLLALRSRRRRRARAEERL